MYSVLLFLGLSVAIGIRSARGSKPISYGALIVMSVLVAVSFTSLRVI